MNDLLKGFIATLSLFGLIACEVKPESINYGSDACAFCQMTIVDKHHAAELVTEKGKIYKYDAIECMMNALQRWNKPLVAYYLVTDYSSPGELTDASEAHFLISPAIPSPMGASLSAFSDKAAGEKTQKNLGGEMLKWTQLREKFNVKL